MLMPISNTPRDYDWGSATLLAGLEGRAPSGHPEAEMWFGDHPSGPARVLDGRTLAQWVQEDAAGTGAPVRLPYLLKLLAAASPLSIQAHPSRAEAAEGFAREEAAGTARDASERTYRDDNHKPELIVALSDAFIALAGLREVEATRRLLAGLGPAADPLAARLDGEDAAVALRDAIAWLLSEQAQAEVDDIIAAAAGADVPEFAAEVALARRLARAYPSDPGVVVAMLMNLVTLRRGEGLFVPAGVLHAYVEGLGVEVMAASDNVLRGGLTRKHIDVPELLRVLDATPGPAPVVAPEDLGGGVVQYPAPVSDFALRRVRVGDDRPVEVPIEGVAIAVVVAGSVRVGGSATPDAVSLAPGAAVYVTPDERRLIVSGRGELFVVEPGQPSP